MALPFTRSEFLTVFAAYNQAVWPAQALLYALAAGAVVAARRGRGGDGVPVRYTFGSSIPSPGNLRSKE
jgi:hypothetical protein